MLTDRKYEPKKENREWYFVEYHPANYFKFANVQLVLTIDQANETDITVAMEKEAKHWLNLYPVPLFVSVFDNTGSLYKFSETQEKNHLNGFLDESGKTQLLWGLLKDEEIPNVALDQEYRNNIYSDFNFTTYAQLDVERQQRRRQIDDGRFIILLWIVITTFVVEIFIYFNQLLSWLAFVFVLYKAIQNILQFANIKIFPISERKKAEELEKRLKDHYYYHCQMNPEGFQRLKLENFERMAKDDIAKEVASLKLENNK